MGNMMAYKMTMFMVFFNIAMGIAIYLGSLFFPDGATTFTPQDTSYVINTLNWLSTSVGTTQGVLALTVTFGLLSLFAFSMLIPTIAFVAAFFALNGVLTLVYLNYLNLPVIFTAPLSLGVIIITFIGISQYMARSTVQGA